MLRHCYLALCAGFLTLVFFCAGASQTPTSATPGPSPSPSPAASPAQPPEKHFVKNILNDQKTIWTAPFKPSHEVGKWELALGFGTAALIASDIRSSGELVEFGVDQHRMNVSKNVSQLGTWYTTSGTAGAFYVTGLLTHNAKARETGVLALQALIDSGIVSTAVKAVTQRPRPTDSKQDDFFDGGNSFPSGHSMSAWTVATVVASEYHKHLAVQITAYGLASAVSVARYTGRNHYLSDVLVGSALGYLIGRFVYRTHHTVSD